MSQQLDDNAMQHAIAVGSTFPWHEVYTADVAGTIKFYTEVLGWETESMDMPGGDGTYHMLKANGTAVCGVFDTAMAGGAPPHWATYIAVDDVAKRLEKAVAAGSQVLVPMMEVPTVGTMALIQDPFGATVWFYTPSAGG
ncbi:MAG: VOC family protein [Fimbriimonadaceae bacterium]